MLKHRVISGCLMGFALLAMLFYAPVGLAWLVLIAVACLAHFEFYALMTARGIPVYRVLGTVGGCALIATTFYCLCHPLADAASHHIWESMVMVAVVLAIFIRQFPERDNKTPLESISCTLLGVFYVGFLLNFITRLGYEWGPTSAFERISVTGQLLVFYLVAVVKCADIGAFFAGSRFGKHKLFPRISPRKTWEGLAGGVLFSVLVGNVILWLTGGTLGDIPVSGIHRLVLPFLLAVVGVIGDMFESLIKRSTGQKDSSDAIPGMGGLLDVLDSLLFGAPVLYAYLHIFLV